jgi:hypothetical protein
MKTILSTILAVAALGGVAFAGDLVPVSNGHGQAGILNRASDSTAAVYSGGQGLGKANASQEAKLQNAGTHGIQLFRAE